MKCVVMVNVPDEVFAGWVNTLLLVPAKRLMKIFGMRTYGQKAVAHALSTKIRMVRRFQ